MINNFLNLLAIGVNGAVHSTTMSEEELAALAAQNHEKLAWIIGMLAVIAGILYFVFAHSKVKAKLAKRREDLKLKKGQEKTQQELDRLHKIKEKNKRK